MKAGLLMDERYVLGATSFVELVIWQLPRPAPGSAHRYKYRLAYVRNNRCILRYDNEAGKGDHRHTGKSEGAYRFTTHEKLLQDFWTDVESLENK